MKYIYSNIFGWSRLQRSYSKIYYPKKIKDINILNIKKVIARGSGLSYGDSALGKYICSSKKLNKIIKFDRKNGTIECESGVTFNQILETIVKSGWFFHVTPGSSFATIGGAIAADVHGKNHHIEGSFSDYLISFKLIKKNKIFNVNKKNRKLFHSTCSGMGLTGFILSAKFKLKKITSHLIVSKTKKFNNLVSLIKHIKLNFNSEYSVAWLDLIGNKNNKINSILYLGSHKRNSSEIKFRNKKQLNLSVLNKIIFLNDTIIKLFNYFYFNFSKIGKTEVDLFKYFYPLDRIKNWNSFYGKKGFTQYQILLPEKKFIKNVQIINKILNKYKNKPYLAVLKLMGEKNNNYLSFPKKGYSLAMDFKYSNNLKSMIVEIDKFIIKNGGRIYLAKDSFLTKQNIKKMYPMISKFNKIRKKEELFNYYESNQSLRLNI